MLENEPFVIECTSLTRFFVPLILNTPLLQHFPQLGRIETIDHPGQQKAVLALMSKG